MGVLLAVLLQWLCRLALFTYSLWKLSYLRGCHWWLWLGLRKENYRLLKQCRTRAHGHKKTDLVILSTLVSACCLLVDQSIIYVIAKSIFKVIKFLKFSVYAQESSKNELSENLCWMNTGHISIFFFLWQMETTKNRVFSILRGLSLLSWKMGQIWLDIYWGNWVLKRKWTYILSIFWPLC